MALKYYFGIAFLNLIYAEAQTIIRFSDGKQIDSVFIVNSSHKVLLNKNNFQKYQYKSNDKILYENKIYDFTLEKDSMILFDKVQEIEAVNIVNNSTEEISVKNKKKSRYVCSIFSNIKKAVFIPKHFNKKSYLKSITIFPRKILLENGILEIFIYENKNGFPKDDTELLKFEKNISDIETGSFEIVLPKAIVYPENGFFILFYIRDKEITLAKKVINLNCNSETKEFMRSDYTQKWTLINFPSIQYKLKILQ
ncbi:MAG: hypothetical protein JNN23_02135 [Chryseobacterium gambrini]|nr:hypothetical protein [Chryseobacterium gambrini]